MNLEKDLKKIKNQKNKSQAKREIAELILSQIENYTQSGVSPVTGGNFKKLSKKYADKKKKLTGSSDPDLHLKNEMISSIVADFKSEGIDFKITDKTQKKKAFNHCVGDTLPKRMFLPDDQKESGSEKDFAPDIRKGVADIIRKYNASSD